MNRQFVMDKEALTHNPKVRFLSKKEYTVAIPEMPARTVSYIFKKDVLTTLDERTTRALMNKYPSLYVVDRQTLLPIEEYNMKTNLVKEIWIRYKYGTGVESCGLPPGAKNVLIDEIEAMKLDGVIPITDEALVLIRAKKDEKTGKRRKAKT